MQKYLKKKASANEPAEFSYAKSRAGARLHPDSSQSLRVSNMNIANKFLSPTHSRLENENGDYEA
jgi:hypothetical protein